MTGNLKDKAFNITLSLFFTCTVLYYFFRFQFDLNFYTVVTQATLMILLSLVGLIRLLSISNLNLSYQKFAYCAAVLYCALLLLLTFFRGGMPGLLYGLKDFFLPILLIFAYKSITTKDTIVFFYKLIGFIGFIVSCIYLLEIYH